MAGMASHFGGRIAAGGAVVNLGKLIRNIGSRFGSCDAQEAEIDLSGVILLSVPRESLVENPDEAHMQPLWRYSTSFDVNRKRGNNPVAGPDLQIALGMKSSGRDVFAYYVDWPRPYVPTIFTYDGKDYLIYVVGDSPAALAHPTGTEVQCVLVAC